MMQRSNIPYRRLPGRARRRFGLFTRQRQELWLAPDHLLLVEYNGFVERYKRFYLRDIRLLVVCRTPAGLVLNGVLSLILTLCILLFLGGIPLEFMSSPGLTILDVILGIVAVVPLISIPLNTIFGPTCACRLHTAVHAERLYALGRMRTADRVITMLRERIEAVQGRFAAGDETDETRQGKEGPPLSIQSADQQKQAEDKEGNAENRAD